MVYTDPFFAEAVSDKRQQANVWYIIQLNTIFLLMHTTYILHMNGFKCDLLQVFPPSQLTLIRI